MYELINAKTQGADHVKHGIPCEDDGQVFESESCRIFAVADGHGDSNCPRSRLGSEIACRIAVSQMKEFCADIADNHWESRILNNSKELDSLARQLLSSIVARWIREVNDDIHANPLTEEERAGCEKYIERYDKGERLEHIYGTTLIAGLMTDKYLLLLQQGDGRCVVFDQDGIASQPVPWDEKCFANVTTSLCDEDAVNRFRYCAIDLESNPVIACIAGSDGVEDSFRSMDLLYSYYRDLLMYASEYGIDALNHYLEDGLFDFSKQGSGDDVTICGIADRDKVAEFVPAFKRQNEIVLKESLIREIDGRLKSMNGMGKIDALESKYKKAVEEASEAEIEYIHAKSLFDSYDSDLKRFNQEENEGTECFKLSNRLMNLVFSENPINVLTKSVNDLKVKMEQADQCLHKARGKLIPIEQEYNAIIERKEELEKKKEKIEKKLEELKKDY